jgi:glycosyltransferase involved in cell wall biosynthesis
MITCDNEIAILMATYNGEKYLAEQIDSLLGQTCQAWHLYIHDDGSKDNTDHIIQGYVEKHPDKVTQLVYPAQGGACRNFLSMVEKVDAPYYMFCDQDDVWMSDKIELTLQEMKRQEASHPQKPVVVHTDLHIVDEHLTITYDSMWRHCGLHPQYIKTLDDAGGHTSIATGCTMLFNQQAKDCCSFSAAKAIMHDCWVCLCALKQGGIVYGINKQLVLYRQHGSNCLGAGATKASDVNIKYRILNFNKVYKSNRNYYVMLRSLGYGSIFKYIYNKVRYKQRKRRGFY